MTDTRRNITERNYHSKRFLTRAFLLVALIGTLVGLGGQLLLSEEEGHDQSRHQSGIWTQDMKSSDAMQGW